MIFTVKGLLADKFHDTRPYLPGKLNIKIAKKLALEVDKLY